jgi:hypothetical protein
MPRSPKMGLTAGLPTHHGLAIPKGWQTLQSLFSWPCENKAQKLALTQISIEPSIHVNMADQERGFVLLNPTFLPYVAFFSQNVQFDTPCIRQLIVQPSPSLYVSPLF